VLENIAQSLSCPDCFCNIKLIDYPNKRKGLSHNLSLKCCNEKCSFLKNFNTSPEIKKQKIIQGANLKEINTRAVIAFREIGCGYASMKTFMSVMNIHSLAKGSFHNIDLQVKNAYKEIATTSMKKAAIEAPYTEIVNNIRCTQVSVDGSWQRRGYSSLHGIVTAITGDKCVDVEIKTRHCYGCKMWVGKENTLEYEQWKLDHNCQINHEGSSGSMESSGAVDIFHRSISNRNLIYKEYLGDGDTSSFLDVVNSKPYTEQGVIPIKLECIGHVQKRMGTRLRSLVKLYSGTKTPLSGRNKLTDKIINSMQNYYGIAIRRNIDNIYAMKKSIFAILFHFTNIPNQDERHQFCPRDSESWCRYWSKTKQYIPSNSIPVWIKNLLMPIYKSLQDDQLLSKCLHGKTQNLNEALHAIIWSRVPKSTFVSRETIEMGTYSAVIHFNDGSKGILDVLKEFNLTGYITVMTSIQFDNSRVNQMMRKSTKECIKQRKKLRSVAKGFSDKLKSNETNQSYISGGH
jgi:hypothetical protein